ncbi:HTH-type transcriptional repressor of iron proteins A [Raoultella terrigena]|uniref:HTH-type transcriptional repressor of iron proteins A n=1 Tax=Raoultella terrigena TaxID=577 RepID=A0A3P8M2Y2_RAOTE|nr:HTH-type transcriptional repressor of iron proteins A [Raoultella terrigena]
MRSSFRCKLLLPTDRRARNVADQLLAHPDSPLTQAQLAQRWGLSVRSLSRLFREQTGLSFCQWRQQAKVVTSLQWVLAGEPIAEVAARSGYGQRQRLYRGISRTLWPHARPASARRR